MNYFEQELRRIAIACDNVTDPVFAARACFADLGGDNRVKLQFVTMGTHERYEALKATVLNRSDGEVDSLILRFGDTWGRKQVSNPNFRDGVIPCIRTFDGKSEWYAYRPTDADIKKLAAELGTYLSVFTDRSRAPEKARIGEKESVMKTIREAKQNPAPRKEAPSRGRPKLGLG